MTSPALLALALSLAQTPAAPPPAAQPPTPPPTVTPPAPPPTLPPPTASRRLTLDEALQLADTRNYDLRAAFARLKQAEQSYWRAWSGYLPQITLGGTYTHTGNAPPPIPFPIASPTPPFTIQTVQSITIVPEDQLQGTADASQMLFSPALWFTIQGTSRGSDAARQGTEFARQQILYGTAQAFYGVATLRETVTISDRLLEIAQRAEKDARVRYQAGTIAKVGLVRAEIDRARAEQDVLRARNGYESARLSLAQILDTPPDFEVVSPDEPRLPADTAKLVEVALQERQDVQSARSSFAAAESGKNAIVGAYFPNVVAFGHYQNANASGLSGSELWSVGLSLQWRIFDGGLREANLRDANARIDEARANLASVELSARTQVNQSLLDLASARANAVKAKEQRDLAAENQRLVDVSYRAGAATAVEQADATASLRNAEVAALTESFNAAVAALHVLQTSGARLR